MVDQPAQDIAFFVRFCAVKSVQFLLTDQKPGDPFSQFGIFAYFIGISGDTDDGDHLVIMVDRKIDTLLCAGKTVIFPNFDHSTALGRLLSDFMEGPDACRICAGKNRPGTVNEIHVLSAQIPDGIYDLLCECSGDVRCHGVAPRAALWAFLVWYIFWSARLI